MDYNFSANLPADARSSEMQIDEVLEDYGTVHDCKCELSGQLVYDKQNDRYFCAKCEGWVREAL